MQVNDFVYISDNSCSNKDILAMEKDMLRSVHFNLTVPTPFVFASRYLKAAAVSAKAGGPTANAGGDEETTRQLAWYLLELSLVEYHMLRFAPSLLAASAVFTALLAGLQQRQQQKHRERSESGRQGIPDLPAEVDRISSAASSHSVLSLSSSSCVTSSSSSSSASSSLSASSALLALSSSPHSSPLGPFWCPVMIRHSGYRASELRECVLELAQLQAQAGSSKLDSAYRKYSSSKYGQVAKLPPAVVDLDDSCFLDE